MVMEVLGEDITPGHVKAVIDEEDIVEKNRRMNKSDGPEKSDLADGSSVVNGETKEVEHVPDSVVPKDAVDEWPENKAIHYLYFIRYRSYEDPKLKAKIENADRKVQRKTQARLQITEALKKKRSEKADLISQLKPLQKEERKFRAVMDGKRKEMEPLQSALGKLRGTKNAATEKGVGLCSSEEELNETIHNLQYCIQHQSNTLAVEKKLLKEIKLLEASREKVIANATLRIKIQESFGQKDSIQDQVKLIGSDLDGARKEQQAIREKIHHLEEKLNGVRAELDSLQNELVAINEARDKAYQTFSLLREERDESNACFFQYRSLMNNVKLLSINKDISALKELSLYEVEKFMSQWSNNEAFRDDYGKRILSSLDARQLSRDGRMRNPDEKQNFSLSPLSSAEPEKEPFKASMKKVEAAEKESTNKASAVSSRKTQQQVIVKPVEVEQAPEAENPSVGDGDNKSPKKHSESNESDPAKLKEMKRKQEIAKAKSAMERKMKLAEKAAAKAAVRAQKEAEKKLKEKEKKARKKAGASLSGDAEQSETETKDAESEPLEKAADANTETLAPEKIKDQFKEKSIRSRSSRAKGQNQMPKALMKKKKQHSYWLWAAAPAAICVILLVVIGYYRYLSW